MKPSNPVLCKLKKYMLKNGQMKKTDKNLFLEIQLANP